MLYELENVRLYHFHHYYKVSDVEAYSLLIEEFPTSLNNLKYILSSRGFPEESPALNGHQGKENVQLG